MSDVSDWDAAAGNNSDPSPDGFPEGMFPSQVNDSSREVMAAVRRFYDDLADGTFIVKEADSVSSGNITGAMIGAGEVGTTQLADDSVTFAKIQNIPQNRLIGRESAGTGDPEAVQVQTAMIAGDAVSRGKIQDDAINAAKIEANAVHTSELATDTDEGYLSFGLPYPGPSTSQETATMSGGRYSFYPQTRVIGTNGTFDPKWYIFRSNGGPTNPFATRITFGGNISGFEGAEGEWRNLFVDSSAPWNLGSGDIPLFIYLKVDTNGAVGGASVCPAPVWGYNGDTDLTPDRVVSDPTVGVRKYKKIIDPGANLILPPWRGGDPAQWNQAAAEAHANANMVEVEIDQTMKNADMATFPHPFNFVDAHETVVLIDPTSTIVDTLAELRKKGENIIDLFRNGYLVLTSDVNYPNAPAGVTVKGAAWA